MTWNVDHQRQFPLHRRSGTTRNRRIAEDRPALSVAFPAACKWPAVSLMVYAQPKVVNGVLTAPSGLTL